MKGRRSLTTGNVVFLCEFQMKKHIRVLYWNVCLLSIMLQKLKCCSETIQKQWTFNLPRSHFAWNYFKKLLCGSECKRSDGLVWAHRSVAAAVIELVFTWRTRDAILKAWLPAFLLFAFDLQQLGTTPLKDQMFVSRSPTLTVVHEERILALTVERDCVILPNKAQLIKFLSTEQLSITNWNQKEMHIRSQLEKHLFCS